VLQHFFVIYFSQYELSIQSQFPAWVYAALTLASLVKCWLWADWLASYGGYQHHFTTQLSSAVII